MLGIHFDVTMLDMACDHVTVGVWDAPPDSSQANWNSEGSPSRATNSRKRASFFCRIWPEESMLGPHAKLGPIWSFPPRIVSNETLGKVRHPSGCVPFGSPCTCEAAVPEVRHRPDEHHQKPGEAADRPQRAAWSEIWGSQNGTWNNSKVSLRFRTIKAKTKYAGKQHEQTDTDTHQQVPGNLRVMRTI